ncbi:MAG: alpha/beta hydrolase [Prevotellaceae bacterium]|jgi:acetyl esterase/lipase|nr:alpha/beta hydrolase [Prevotellaceae bacterium]
MFRNLFNRSCWLLLASLVFVSSSAAAQEVVALWGDSPPSRKMRRSQLYVFSAPKPTSDISVIICPGGSYYWLDMDNEGYAVARWLNEQGLTAFVLRYRTARRGNHHPAMIQDLQRALQIVKEGAIGYGLNPAKVGVMGFSAGGHLAGTAATYFDTCFVGPLAITPKALLRPAFAAMIYPVVTMSNEATVHKKSRKNLLSKRYTPQQAQAFSLEQNVRPDMPHVFLLHCTGDKTVSYHNSLSLDSALTAKGVPHKLLLVDESGHGGHGFGIQPNGKTTGWQEDFLEWMKAAVR